jgi:hypothetical protein
VETSLVAKLPNPRLQRTPSASPPSPLSRKPLGAMKRQLGAVLTLALVAACSSTASPYVRVSSLPELGSRFVPPEPAIAVVSRGGTRQTFGVEVKKIKFHVMVDATDSRVVSISTRDRSFVTAEGARVGDSASSIASYAGRWTEAHRTYLLASGWRAQINSENVVDQLEKEAADGA